MNDQVAWIKRINQHLITQLGEERSELVQQFDALRKQSDAIQKSLGVLDAKKDQILAAEKLQVELLSSSSGFDFYNQLSEEQDSEAEETTELSTPIREIGKLKARVGDQRYLILDVLRNVEGAAIEFLAFRTGLPERRVRDAVVADQNLGVLEKSGVSNNLEDSFRLTDVGLDLMNRFDEYRRHKGLPLPVLPNLSELPSSGTINSKKILDSDLI